MSPRRPEASDYYAGGPLTEAQLLTAYGLPSGNPIDVHRELRELRELVDAMGRELLTVRQLVELLVADAELEL